MSGSVLAVSKDALHRFSKQTVSEVQLLTGLGVKGDAHLGTTVQHRSRVAADPSQPNLRQVHLIQAELFHEMQGHGFDLAPADLGENITTQGIDLLALPRGALLRVGDAAVLEVTGLRNPCAQIDAFRPGLLRHLVQPGANGMLIRRAGIMAVVRTGGLVRPSDQIKVTLPPPPHQRLERV